MTKISRVEKLTKSSDATEVIYMKLMKFRGSCGCPYLLLVEGNDDVTFIDAALIRVNPEARNVTAAFNCDGKENVLNIYDMIEESNEYSLSDFWFFIDRDYDDMRGRGKRDKIWMTPTYSFENILVSEHTLDGLLKGEYRCNDLEGLEDISNVKDKYKVFISSCMESLRFPNMCVFYAVTTGVKTHNHEETITQSIKVKFPRAVLEFSDVQVAERMGKDGPLDIAAVKASEEAFNKLDPITRWRGKFLFAAYVAFLDELKKDRGTKTPKIFKSKAKMAFNPRVDPIRALTSLAVLPECLQNFLKTIPQN